MKKILSILLAASLVFALSATASAETTYYLTNQELQLTDNDEPYTPDEAPADSGNANNNPGTGC